MDNKVEIGDLLFYISLGFVTTLLLFSLAGCGGLPPPKEQPVANTHDSGDRQQPPGSWYEDDASGGGGGGGGNLPLDYYTRQCQWDACGGPLPDRGAASNPIREMGRP
jgi:hypothetical protein